jgi:hypothetical protein
MTNEINKFSDKSMISINYGRKISQINATFKSERIKLFDLIKDKIKELDIQLYNEDKEDRGYHLNFRLKGNKKLFSSDNWSSISFTGRDGKTSNNDEEEDYSNKPNRDFYIQLRIEDKKKGKEIEEKRYEQKLCSQFKYLDKNATKRDHSYFKIVFEKKFIYRDFDKIAEKTAEVLKYALNVIE